LVRLVHQGDNVEINNRTILMEKHALCPPCFQLRDYSYPNAWMVVTHGLTSSELEKELSFTGWTFFYMASAIRATSFGFDRAKMIHAALKRIIATVKKQRCNCLEIDAVTMHSILGMPYVNVSAHPRHIQKGMVFSGK
jgi:hypothetical protein